MNHLLARFGAHLGNWNDRRSGHDIRKDASRTWVVLDRVAAGLCRRGDRALAADREGRS